MKTAIIWLGACLLLGISQPLFAQPDTENDRNHITSFKSKEDDMRALIAQQKPLLEQMQRQVALVTVDLKSWEDTLQVRDNVPRFRDQAMMEVAALRRTNDQMYEQLRELNMQWFTYSRHIMAVYTRYGELLARDQVDDSLKDFLVRHREIIFQMEDLLALLKENNVLADFLLNARLN